MNPVTASTVVIGGGQAGLAVARCLQRREVAATVLEAAEQVGDSWRRRYESLRLFTPAQYDGLPDLPFPAADDTYPTKDEVAAYLVEYVRHFGLDVRTGVRVDRLSLDDRLGGFVVETNARHLRADRVVVATGALQRPWRPAFAGDVSPDIAQLHTADYRDPASVTGGRVLVVGAGNSGAQIAEELADAPSISEVTVSVDRLPKRLPQRMLGRDVFWWLQRLGVLDRTRDPAGDSAGTVGAVPLIGSRLPELLRSGRVRRAGRIVGADVEGLRDADGRTHRPDTVIWATGFRNDFGWIDIPHVVDRSGQPVQVRGSSTVAPGLAFVGLPGLHTKGSAFLGFVGRDAEHLADVIAAQGSSRSVGPTR